MSNELAAAKIDLALPWNSLDMHIKDSQGRIVASVLSSTGTFTNEELDAREEAIVSAVNERDALLAEIGRLREALDNAWTNAIEVVNKTDMRLRYLSESGEEIVRQDRARVIAALESARAALNGKVGEGNG